PIALRHKAIRHSDELGWCGGLAECGRVIAIAPPSRCAGLIDRLSRPDIHPGARRGGACSGAWLALGRSPGIATGGGREVASRPTGHKAFTDKRHYVNFDIVKCPAQVACGPPPQCVSGVPVARARCGVVRCVAASLPKAATRGLWSPARRANTM